MINFILCVPQLNNALENEKFKNKKIRGQSCKDAEADAKSRKYQAAGT